VEDNGFIVTPNPAYGFIIYSKRKDVDPSDKPTKFLSTDKADPSSLSDEPCDYCGRSTQIKLNGKSYPQH
jgi:hypothetical protein